MGDVAVTETVRAEAPTVSVPVRLAAVFLPAPLPREGRVAFWDPDGGPVDAVAGETDGDRPGGPTELTVVRRHGAGVRRGTAPALSLPLAEALPLLVRARHDPAAHPATACWGAAALHALRLTARGRLLPGLTATGHDAWRAGPLDPDDIAHLRSVAAALPPDTVLAEDGSALVFTQYVGMARLITAHLAARAVPVDLLHGGTPVPERERMVDRFQSGAIPVLVLSLKAAGTGLNLTRAGHVVHVDRWWNPAVEEQATDRAYRIGQTQPVQVHRLITEGTVEDRIAEMLQSKRALADAILGSGESALTELTARELSDLVSLRRPS
ncbi:hypothetical protein SVIOM342S_06028 [Streptomyces violaceorubidus]